MKAFPHEDFSPGSGEWGGGIASPVFARFERGNSESGSNAGWPFYRSRFPMTGWDNARGFSRAVHGLRGISLSAQPIQNGLAHLGRGADRADPGGFQCFELGLGGPFST
uniref:Uncharacterized protein n=1 Tax=Candidatus Kentrum sp. SD TaxID=2126332 RepID=A0A450YJH6_9GAMM|nr:MAG: hypothetical protein BECKSD772F_GA0070984_10998 [Candidatus Kentron sp. SD]